MKDAPLRIILQIAVPISAPGDASVPITGGDSGGGGWRRTQEGTNLCWDFGCSSYGAVMNPKPPASRRKHLSHYELDTILVTCAKSHSEFRLSTSTHFVLFEHFCNFRRDKLSNNKKEHISSTYFAGRVQEICSMSVSVYQICNKFLMTPKSTRILITDPTILRNV